MTVSALAALVYFGEVAAIPGQGWNFLLGRDISGLRPSASYYVGVQSVGEICLPCVAHITRRTALQKPLLPWDKSPTLLFTDGVEYCTNCSTHGAVHDSLRCPIGACSNFIPPQPGEQSPLRDVQSPAATAGRRLRRQQEALKVNNYLGGADFEPGSLPVPQ